MPVASYASGIVPAQNGCFDSLADVASRGRWAPALRETANLRREGSRGDASLTIFKESAIETEAASSQDRSDNMTEPDVLSRDINALKALQRDAWQELASPSLTTFDRREIRNRIRQSEIELRGNLQMMSERLRFRPRPVEIVDNGLAKLNFRLL